MSLNKLFERKVLFVFGRSFWNLLGIIGLVTTVVGGTTLIKSHYESTESYVSNNITYYSFESSYEDFIFKVNQGNVARILIYPNLGVALYLEMDGTVFKVVLEQDQNLMQTLNRNNVDVAVDPKSTKFETKDYLKNKLLQRDKGVNYTLLGVGTVAITSVLSSVLSTERNTRGN